MRVCESTIFSVGYKYYSAVDLCCRMYFHLGGLRLCTKPYVQSILKNTKEEAQISSLSTTSVLLRTTTWIIGQ